MDKAVIDEMFAEEEQAVALRHSDEEMRTALENSRDKAQALRSRIEAIRGELCGLQEELRTQGDALEDLYDDLDFSQQTLAGGVASEVLKQSEEMEKAADELDGAVDALSDLLLFRF